MKDHISYKIALSNHKGGVGKTTLTANISAALAAKGKRVLLVDSDPQCNLTSYLIEDNVVNDMLDKSDSRSGRTIWSAVKPVVEAEGDYRYVDPIETAIPNLWLLPGDIRLAEFESSLNDFWDNCFQRKVKGFRGTNALSSLVKQCSQKLKTDYLFYDTGPNIGPLNRVILLDCNYFIVPAACDLFSIRALKSLGRILASWISDWKTISSLAPDNIYLMEGKPRFLGYIPQRFKVYGGRPTSISTHYISRIEKAIYSDIVSVLRRVDPELATTSMRGLRLGEIKDFANLVQLGQSEGLPIFDVSEGSPAQREEAKIDFNRIADAIITKTYGGICQ
jgi:cellulose biosynthesis protein BcsQ